jgi:glycosyltransferase involved in cell wall biosynthesis
MELSIVVPTYNRAAQLARCLGSLAAQTMERDRFEVVVVDDGSTDGSAAVAGRFSAQLNLVCLRRPHSGVAAARNAGINGARGGIVAFVDDDCVVDPEYARKVCLAHGESVGRVIVCKPVSADKSSLYGQTWEFFAQLLLEAGNAGGVSRDAGFLGAGISSFKRGVFDACGLFDEGIDVGEDRDLQERLVRAGVRLSYLPDIEVAHHYADSLPGFLGKWFCDGRRCVAFYRRRPGFPGIRVVSLTRANFRKAWGRYGLPRGAAIFALRGAAVLAFHLGLAWEGNFGRSRTLK